MGSFNISCFASLQTIRPGDKCRVVAIRQSGSYSPAQIAHEGGRLSLYGVASSDCFANAFWQPISMLIEAKYDDCGRVSLELEGGAGARTRRQVLGLLRRLVAENLQIGGEERGAPARTFDLVQFAQEHAPAVLAVLQDGEADGAALAASEIQKCWDYVWAAAQSYRLFTTDGYRGWRPRQLSAMRSFFAWSEYTPKQFSRLGFDKLSFLFPAGLAKLCYNFATFAIPPSPGFAHQKTHSPRSRHFMTFAKLSGDILSPA